MTVNEVESLHIIGHQVIEVRELRSDVPRRMVLTITMNGSHQWTFNEPGWRPISFGASDEVAYIWSARNVILLPTSALEDPESITLDEDILYVFFAEAEWLIVCETSVRRVIGREETERLDFGETLERAQWDGDELIVAETGGTRHKLHIGSRLSIGDD